MASVNRATIIGNIGNDPEIRYSSAGDAIANLSIATTDSWKDKNGAKQEKQNGTKSLCLGSLLKYAENI